MERPCPDASRYSQLLTGQLSPVEVAGLADHLETCPSCVGTVARLGEDTLSSALRTAAHARPDPEAERVESIIDQCKLLATPSATDSETLAPVEDASDDAKLDLSFLSPPKEAGEIGRLNGYRILKLLGQGGMGMVFEAIEVKLKRRVALKVMKPEVAARASHRQRFVREAQAAAAVEHDNIVPIFHVDEVNGVPFIAMPFLKGMPLDARLKAGPLSLPEIIAIGRQTAAGLAEAHSHGQIHRDIKPANLWLESSPGRESGEVRVKILDFGLARLATQEGEIAGNLTQSGAILGTPAYMAPEQARGEPVDQRADLFSLGCVLYEMATGQRAFRGTNTMAVLTSLAVHTPATASAINPALPPALVTLIHRLLEKDPAKRPGNAAAVVHTLRALQPDSTVVAIPTALVVEQASPWAEIDDDRTEITSPVPLATVAKRRSKKPLLPVAVAIGFLLMVGVGFAAYKLVFETKDGTLVVEVDGDADVRFKSGELRLHDAKGELKYTLKPSERNSKLAPGEYRISVVGADGLTLTTDRFEMKNGGQASVRVTIDPKAVAAVPIDPKGFPKKDPVKSDADRVAAEWVLTVGGKIRIQENGREGNPRSVPELPPGPFELRMVDLTGNSKLLDFALTRLRECKELTHLFLTSTPVTNSGSVHLRGCTNLTLLDLRGTKVTADGVNLLLKALPNCKIEWDSQPGGDWQPLLGKDLSGWTVVGVTGWSVKDGVLGAAAVPADKPGGSLLTERQFENYELEYELRSLDRAEIVPVVDKVGPGNAWNVAFSPAGKAIVELGKWQRIRVVENGRKLTMELNGIVIAEHSYAGDSRGHLGLRLAEGRMEYRNLRVHPKYSPGGRAPADDLKRSDIPPATLAAIGDVPGAKELVAVLGDIDPAVSATVMRNGISFVDDTAVQLSRNNGSVIRIKTGSGPAVPEGELNLDSDIIHSLASPIGDRVVFETSNKGVALWDNRNGKLIGELPDASLRLHVAAFSADGKMLLTPGKDGNVYLWNARDGKRLAALAETGTARSMAFSPDGHWAAVGFDEYPSARLVDVRAKQWAGRLRAPAGEAHGPLAIVFARDNNTIAAGRENVFLWTRDGKTAPRKIGRLPTLAFSLSFNQDASLLAGTGEYEGLVTVWNVADGTEKFSQAGLGGETAVAAFSPDGKALAVASQFLPVTLLDAETGQPLPRDGNPVRFTGLVSVLAISPDGKLLAVGTGPVVRLWSMATGKLVRSLGGHKDRVMSVAFNADGTKLVSADRRGIHLWDMTAVKAGVTMDNQMEQTPGVVFRGDSLISNKGRGGLIVWTPEGKSGSEWNKPSEQVTALAMSQDGKTLAVGGASGEISILDPATGERLQQGKAGGEVNGLAFRPGTGELAVTVRIGNETVRPNIFRMDPKTMKMLPAIEGGFHADHSPAYRPDGGMLAAGSFDGTLRTWDMTGATPKPGFTFKTPLFPKSLSGVAWTPDGRHLTVGTPSGAVLVFRLADPPLAAADSDRKAAEYALAIGGTVRVNGRNSDITALADLPKDRFQLTAVTIRMNPLLTDDGLAVFRDCGNLKSVELGGSPNFTAAGLAHFKDCRQLEALLLWQTKTDDRVWDLLDGFPKLADLDLDHTAVSKEGMAALAKYGKLTRLVIGGTKIDDNAMASLKNHRDVQLLGLWGTRVSSQGLAHLKEWRKLRHINLDHTKVDDSALAYFKGCKDLSELFLDGTQITDDSVASIKVFDRLTVLSVRKTEMSATAIETLCRALPRCIIQSDHGRFGPK